MSKQYYFQNIFFGLFLGCFSFYEFFNSGIDNEFIWLIFISINTVLYPFSKNLVEKTVLKYTSKDFWNRGFFMDTPAKLGLLAIYQVFCFVFAFIIGFMCLIKEIRATNQ